MILTVPGMPVDVAAAWRGDIHVCPLSRLEATANRINPGALVTLVSEGTRVTRPAMIDPAHHLVLTFHDIDAARDGLVPASGGDVARLIDFFEGLKGDRPLLIHCFAGISRSTAAAFVALCHFNPAMDEATLARHLRRASPSATPNRRIVGLADDQLERDGRMVSAIAAIGRGADAFEGTPFSLPARFDDA